jgi:hypothetical protein
MTTLKRPISYAIAHERDYGCVVGEVHTRKDGELPRYVPTQPDQHMAMPKADTGEWERYIHSVLRQPDRDRLRTAHEYNNERKIQALIDHPDTIETERQAAIRAIARKRKAKREV